MDNHRRTDPRGCPILVAYELGDDVRGTHDFSVVRSGSTTTLRSLDNRIKRIEELLRVAKCPDDACDGEGTCAGLVPGYDGEADIDWWECQWCAARKEILKRP